MYREVLALMRAKQLDEMVHQLQFMRDVKLHRLATEIFKQHLDTEEEGETF